METFALHEKTLQSVVVMMGRKVNDISNVQYDITCSLISYDEGILKQGTITTSKINNTIYSMKYSVSPVVRIAVNAKNPADLPKLVSGLQKMSKADPFV